MVQLPVKILGAASLKSQPFKPLCSLAKGWRATGKTAAATVHCALPASKGIPNEMLMID